jgi:hypothetical protein
MRIESRRLAVLCSSGYVLACEPNAANDVLPASGIMRPSGRQAVQCFDLHLNHQSRFLVVTLSHSNRTPPPKPYLQSQIMMPPSGRLNHTPHLLGHLALSRGRSRAYRSIPHGHITLQPISHLLRAFRPTRSSTACRSLRRRFLILRRCHSHPKDPPAK